MKNKNFWLINLFLLFGFAGIVLVVKFGPQVLLRLPLQISSFLPGVISTKPLPKIEAKVAKFTSEEEFKKYLEENKEQEGNLAIAPMGRGEMAVDMAMPTLQAAPETGAIAKSTTPERISETNVQVAGIDEPDIVKTDGKQIYFSSDMPIFRSLPEPVPMPTVEDGEGRSATSVAPSSGKIGIMPRRTQGETKVIKAFPPAELKKQAGIEKTGNLLLSGDILVIFSGQDIFGFDVSDPTLPTQKWRVELKNNSSLMGTRLYKNKVYLVTQSYINSGRPCPIVPLISNGTEIAIKCVDIYHPVAPVSVNVAFTAMALDPVDGEVLDTLSFVGSSGSSVIYMSESSIFVTYTYSGDMVDFFYKFLKEKGKDLVPESLINRLEKLATYDISSRAKWTELSTILEEYKAGLDDDGRLKMENEFNNRMQDFAKEHGRDLQKTGIAKIDLSSMRVLATGGVPGQPLNQFSLDEYKDHLRLATTTGGTWMFGTRSESVNDVYVLDKNLVTVGSILNMGLSERIYAARFIEDKGYLVTFRQTDPFYVLDLSNPSRPQKRGELKIPGFSSYLHPIDRDKILGIGREGSKVKISFFDVSDPSNPTELDKYLLDEYWSEIETTHHAFLLDSQHQVFFLPGSKGGYVFSYKGNKLELLKAVSDIRAKRAIYLDDYLYIIGEDKIVVLSENDWQKVNQLDF